MAKMTNKQQNTKNANDFIFNGILRFFSILEKLIIVIISRNDRYRSFDRTDYPYLNLSHTNDENQLLFIYKMYWHVCKHTTVRRQFSVVAAAHIHMIIEDIFDTNRILLFIYTIYLYDTCKCVCFLTNYIYEYSTRIRSLYTVSNLLTKTSSSFIFHRLTHTHTHTNTNFDEIFFFSYFTGKIIRVNFSMNCW